MKHLTHFTKSRSRTARDSCSLVMGECGSTARPIGEEWLISAGHWLLQPSQFPIAAQPQLQASSQPRQRPYAPSGRLAPLGSAVDEGSPSVHREL
eukprot:CAMPEP_0117526706 /NCGR_PEP_ID=MMETSP0784-20121206/36422_1 /TAXON_ID=39447 /ORGANISM="" /LENGTH=94 /DNA_ID=CAMNT_0005322939 /DNA_START=355 /DNA_END=637 /DNA_ORIENTATION=+